MTLVLSNCGSDPGGEAPAADAAHRHAEADGRHPGFFAWMPAGAYQPMSRSSG